MEWLAELGKYNAERQRIVQLRHKLDWLSDQMREQTAGLKTNSDDFRKIVTGFGHEADLIIGEIDEIETEQMLARAEKWRIPVPMRPYGNHGDTDFWAWNPAFGRHFLTDEAKLRIRRDVFEEREMFTKPIVTWAALAISIVALVVSVLKP